MPSVLITETSCGIGMESALEFARRGFLTIATMRNLAKADGLRQAAADGSLTVEILELDVTDPDSVTACLSEVLARGPLDVLVNNAGVAGAKPFELVEERLRRVMFEANYFRVMR